MSLKETIQTAMKTAMKAKAKEDLSVIRVLWAAIRKKEIDEKKDLSDEEVIGLIQKDIKSREETLGFLKKDDRKEDILVEEKAVNLLRGWLPKQLEESEVIKMIEEAKEKTGATSPKDMGKLMGLLMGQLKGKFDSRKLSTLVKESLNG